MKIPINAVTKTVELLIRTDSKRATKYLASNLVVSAQYKCSGNKIDNEGMRRVIVLKIGAPNYQEREFIALCKKAKEPFPVKKIQLKAFPKKEIK